MRIDALRKLATKNPTPQSKFIFFFLNEQFYLASEDEDVTYHNFISYLHEMGLDLNKQNTSSDISDAELFYQFIIQEKKEHKEVVRQEIIKNMNPDATLDLLPKHLRETQLGKFLDPKSLVNLSSTCSALYSEIKGILYWDNKLIEAGCNKDLLKKVIQSNIIQNYKNLYRAFMNMPYKDRTHINDSWEIFYLSGEPRAIHYTIYHEGIATDTKNKCR